MESVKFFLKNNAAVAAALLGFSVVTASVPAFAETTITIAGSTALLPLVKDAANAYQQAHPDVKISVSGGGSGSGIAQVSGKAVQIGDSDITAPTHPELHDNRVAVVGFAIVVHPGVGVKNLSKKQLQDIFSGKVANWKDVGGADQKMVVVNRPRSSGTRAVFAKTIMGGVPINESGLTEDATGTVVSVVKQTPGAISYAAFSGTRGSGLTELAVDGVEPTDDNIIHGKYAIWSYEHMFTLGPPTGEVSRFIAFVQSNSGLVKKDGFILIRDMRVTETDR
jgi:phosphate transport system substrate-binding protein